MLSKTQIDFYQQNGFLVLENWLNQETCDMLREEALRLVDAFDIRGHRSIFTTNEQTRSSDNYFLTSGDKIRFFLEEDAFAEDGSLRQEKSRSINKIGHALHDLNPAFQDISYSPALAALLRIIGFQKPLAAQSMYIFKQPNIGGAVNCHQDSAFLYTDPPSVVGCWLALEDATLENGCLWALPGGHTIPLKSRFVRNEKNDSTRFIIFDETPLPTDGLQALEVEKGTMILLHGQLPHLSKPNRSKKSRHAYTLHVIEGTYPYPADNWLQRPSEMPYRMIK